MTLEQSLSQEAWAKIEPLIHANFEARRDYIYKFALLIFGILGFLVTFIASRNNLENVQQIYLGFEYLLVAGLTSPLFIFCTLFLERKFFAAHYAFTQSVEADMAKPFGNHTNPVKCVELRLKDIIKQRKSDLPSIKDKIIKIEEVQGIAVDLRNLKLMKYVGLKFTKYEYVWSIFTFFIILCAGIGLFLVIGAII